MLSKVPNASEIEMESKSEWQIEMTIANSCQCGYNEDRAETTVCSKNDAMMDYYNTVFR